ncbi:MAG: hypothetical protein M3Q97_01840, partial [Bacteroidota bacterium]|nr:hypothetical protein [Bacteroidota bacterium]
NYFEFLAQELRRVEWVAGKYASGKLDMLEKAGINTALVALERFSKAGAGSAELLCYGYHVLARKK